MSQRVEIKFKLTHPDAKLPFSKHESDSGRDIVSIEDKYIPAGGSAVIDTGLEVAFIDPEYWFKIEARSGLGFKHGVYPHPGIIDTDYRGNLGIKIYNTGTEPYTINKGDRIAQLVVYPRITPVISEAIKTSETERGAGGFGSTGK